MRKLSFKFGLRQMLVFSGILVLLMVQSGLSAPMSITDDFMADPVGFITAWMTGSTVILGFELANWMLAVMALVIVMVLV